MSKWYDQSGGTTYDLSVAASGQPRIATASGVVILENGKPCLTFNGTSHYFTLGGTNDAGMVGDISVFSVNKALASGDTVVAKGLTNSNTAAVMQWGINTQTSNQYMGSTSDGTTRINKYITTASFGSQLLISMINDESGNLQMFVDGVGSGGQTAVAPMNDAAYPLEIGRDPWRASLNFEGTQQELILFASDQSTNRTGMEWNINNHYSIYEQWDRKSCMNVRRSSDDTTKQIGFDGSSNMSEAEVLSFVNEAGPVLDDYTGAVSAYSLRKVRTAYTGSAIKVRRSSDDALQDIGFYSNGDLDTTALLSFVGNNLCSNPNEWANGVTRNGWTEISGSVLKFVENVTDPDDIY